jgi:hypothetical protein
MEIFIRLAGTQLGPYTETQVRQHIDEGLLSLTDVARTTGTLEWVPLSDVLAKLPPTSEPVAEPPAPPEPKVAPQDVPEAPKRTPAAFGNMPPATTQPDPVRLPPSDLGGLDKKTVLLGPTPPVRAPAIGKAASPNAITSPLQATKSVSRPALVKAIAQTTSPLPTKAINPPGPPPPQRAPPPPCLMRFPRPLIRMRNQTPCHRW